MPSDVRGSILEAVERVMLDHELRDDARTAQAADAVLARTAAKARK